MSSLRVALTIPLTTASIGLCADLHAQEGTIDFFLANGGGRSNYAYSAACRLPRQTQTYNLKERKVGRCGNDAVRSMEFVGTFPRGFEVRVYDSPDGKQTDDWTSIRVKRDLLNTRVLVGTFENNFENQDIKVVYHRKNGLDGKVSRIATQMP